MYELKDTLDYPNNLLANIEAYKNNIDPSDIACLANIPDDTVDRIKNVLNSLKYCWFCDEDILEVFLAYFIRHKSIEDLSIEVKWHKSLVVDRITNIIKILSLDLYYNIIFSVDDPDIFNLDQTYIGFDKRFGNSLKRYRDNYEFNNAGIETVQDIKVFLERNNNNFDSLGKIRGIGNQSIEGIKLLIELFDKYYKCNITLIEEAVEEEQQCNVEKDDRDIIIEQLKNENSKLKYKILLLETLDVLEDSDAELYIIKGENKTQLDKGVIIKALIKLFKDYMYL